MTHRFQTSMIVRFLAILLLMPVSACASVGVVRLTDATVAPIASVEDVEVLEQEPACPYVRLTELHMDDPLLSFARMQEHLVTRAARLGADAVVCAKPVRQIEHQVA